MRKQNAIFIPLLSLLFSIPMVVSAENKILCDTLDASFPFIQNTVPPSVFSSQHFSQEELINMYNNQQWYEDKGETKLSPCIFHKTQSGMTISLACFHNPSDILLQDNFTGIVENQRKHIQGFTTQYDTQHEQFSYNGSFPRRANPTKQTLAHMRQQIINGPILAFPLSSYSLTLTQEQREILAMNFYSYFVTQRDISMYGYCNKKNFYVASLSVDKKYLEPGEEFNLNKRIAYRLGYCKDTDENIPFYGGVCGVASLVFRTALLHPDLEVLERSPHQIWYSVYYGTNIRGDDATVAQYYRQLRLRNASPYPLYYKFHDTIPEKSINIVVISPTTQYKKYQTTISKKQTGELSATLDKTVYKDNQLLNTIRFDSTYERVSNIRFGNQPLPYQRQGNMISPTE